MNNNMINYPKIDELPNDIFLKITDNDKETIEKTKITKAAIMLRNNTVTGRYHCDIRYVIREVGLQKDYEDDFYEDGFIIKYEDKEYFLDREDATKVAKVLGIIPKNSCAPLNSENLH